SRFGEVLFFYPDERDGDGTECSRCVIYNWDEGVWYTDDTPRTDWIGQGIFPNPIAFGTDGMMYFQETDGTANGNPLSWSLTTGALDLGAGDTWYNLMRLDPDFADQQGAVTAQIYSRRASNDPWSLKRTT